MHPIQKLLISLFLLIGGSVFGVLIARTYPTSTRNKGLAYTNAFSVFAISVLIAFIIYLGF